MNANLLAFYVVINQKCEAYLTPQVMRAVVETADAVDAEAPMLS